jgi:acetyltransferase-like isoleucine patch superfamily enzyme
MRGIAGSLVRYATTHVIAHIPVHSLRIAWYRRVLGWEIAPEVTILMGATVRMGGVRTGAGNVSIGEGSVINSDCLLYTTGGITIGRNVSISEGAWLVTGTHDMEDPGFPDRYLPIEIGDHAWIGMRATVLAGVSVGEGAVVMAGAVVTRDVAAHEVVGGVPARVVRQREAGDLNYALKVRRQLD